MIYDRAKFECGKWRATFTALIPMWSTVNGGLPLPALPFFRVVYMDTDVSMIYDLRKVGTIRPMDLLFMVIFNDQSMRI